MEYGVCSQPWVMTEADVQGMQAIGVQYCRIDMRRSDMWTFDTKMQWMKQYGITPVLLLKNLVSVPSLASGQFDAWVAEYGQFVYDVVRHYGPNSPVGLHAEWFELGNEVNNRVFWTDPDATLDYNQFYNRGLAISKYVTVLQEAYTRAKEANPDCKVIGGGIGCADKEYLQGMYDYGAKGYFDYLSVHPYFNDSPTEYRDPDYYGPVPAAGADCIHTQCPSFGRLPQIDRLRAVMEAHGDAMPMFVTEVGCDCKSWGGVPITPETQADRLTRVMNRLASYPYVKATCWYIYRNTDDSGSSCFRMVLEDGTLTPMYHAYKNLIEATLKSIVPLILLAGIILLLK